MYDDPGRHFFILDSAFQLVLDPFRQRILFIIHFSGEERKGGGLSLIKRFLWTPLVYQCFYVYSCSANIQGCTENHLSVNVDF